jgi:hypothetical protein
MKDLPTAALDALEHYRANEQGWRRQSLDQLASELEHATIMPDNTRADYTRAAALALHLAERVTHG